MRLSDVTLLKYGHFDGRRLAFPAPDAGGPDLHVVLGANEAGKSTFRSAVVDFLFGFPRSPRHAFRFEMSQLAVGATVETGEGAHALVRLKKAKDDLRTDAGAVADPGLLAAALAGLDRDAFEREQALGHDDLPRGGRELERYADDLAGQLFGAATGLKDCIGRQRALEETAAGLFKADGRAKTAWREARRDFDAAQKALRGAETRRSAFERLQRERRQAEEALDGLRRERDALTLGKAGLERLVRLAPAVARLRAAESAIAAMAVDGAPPPLLPEDTAERVREAERTVAVARNAAETAARDRADRERRLEAVLVDADVLAAGEEIGALADQAVVVGRQADDIVRRRAEADNARRLALDEARAIGRAAGDADALAAGLPSRTDRAELAEVEGRRAAIEARAADHAERIAEIDERLAAIAAESEALPPEEDVAPARAALATARELGDVARNRAPLAAAAESAATRRDRLRAGLAPWSGDLDALAALVPPERAALERAQAERRRLEDEIRRLGEQLEERRTTRKRLAAERDSRSATEAVPDADALAAARERRDALWHAIRAGERALAAAAPDYEAAVAEADGVADARFAGAETATLLERTRAEIEGLAAEEEETAERIETRRRALAAASDEWRALLAARGFPEIAPESIEEWLKRREEALAAAREAGEAAEALAAFDRRVAAARAALAEALPAAAKRPATDDLDAWRAAVEVAVEAASETAARRRALAERRRTALQDRESLAAKAEAAEAERDALAGRRTRLAAACGLDPDASGERVRVTLEALERIETHLETAERIRRERIDTMERDRRLFEESARALAARLAPDLAAQPADAVARTLSDRLADARSAAAERDRLRKEIAGARAAAEEAERTIAATEAALAPLFASAGLDPSAGLPALAAAAERSDAFRARLAERRAAEDTIAADSDGRPIAEIAAAVESGETDERRREVAEMAAALADAEGRLEEATRAAVEARNALAAVTGGDATGSPVTRAAGDKAQAAGRLAEIAADHMWAFMEARLMRWAIERYRTENQSPLVARAGALFARLTCGRYARLEADVGESAARLLAIEANSGAGLAVDQLSSGTRDQLFLALRLAASDLRNGGPDGAAEGGRRVPFVADDLFVNADDDRAAAGLAVLAELARRTQIVYLTHHAHLVEIARETLGDAVNVVEL